MGAHGSRELESMIIMVGSVAAEKQECCWSNNWELTYWDNNQEAKEGAVMVWTSGMPHRTVAHLLQQGHSS